MKKILIITILLLLPTISFAGTGDINLIAKIAPYNDGFVGMVDAKQIIGGLGNILPSSVTELIGTIGSTTGATQLLGSITMTKATTTSFGITGLARPAGSFLAVDPNGSIIATSTNATTTNLFLDSVPTGAILIATSSNKVSWDNSNLFWDWTNKRLGIGTVSPGTKLHIVADTSNYNIRLEENTGGEYFNLGMQPDGSLRISDDISATRYIDIQDGVGGFSQVYEGGLFQNFMYAYSDTASHRFVQQMYHIGGTIASPTTTPTNATLAQFYFSGYNNGLVNGAAVFSAEAEGEWGTAGDTSDNPTAFTFSTTPNGSGTVVERMRINNAGNVGIGTSTPNYKLTVNTGGFSVEDSTTNFGGFTISSNARIATFSGIPSGTTLGTASLVVNPATKGDTNRLLFGVGVAGSAYFTVDGEGEVGISTTTPNNKLDIYSTSKSAIGFSGASGSTYKWAMGMDVTNGGRFSIASSTALGTTDRLVILGNGNVGIGKTNPATMLDIAGIASSTGLQINGSATTTTRFTVGTQGTSYGCIAFKAMDGNWAYAYATSATSLIASDHLDWTGTDCSGSATSTLKIGS